MFFLPLQDEEIIYLGKFTLSGNLLAVIFSAGAVASNIVLAVLASSAVKRYATDELTCSIALGVFFFLAFAIAMMALPISTKRAPEENTVPVSMFCGNTVCACCCDTACEDASDEAPSSEDTAEEEVTEITDSDEDIHDIEDLKALDGDEE